MRESEVRKKIIDTAARLFHGQGYNATGINQIIAEAKVAKRSLYQHFESKTDLLIAYLDQFQDNWYATIHVYLADMENPNERVLALFDFRIFYQEKHLFPGCPFSKINAEVGFDQERINLRVQQGKNVFKEFILNLVKDAVHKEMLNDQEFADMIFLIIEGALISTSIYKSTDDLKNGKLLVAKFL